MRAVLFFIFFILWWQVAAAQTTAQTVFTIELHENGDALWTGEKRYPLTVSELNEWDLIIKKGENISKYQKDIKEDVDALVQSAQKSTNRSMNIEKFNISYDTVKTISGGFGVIRYGFVWTNFSKVESGEIVTGDAFSEGDVLPADITLVIKIPDGYDIKSASPSFDRHDGNRLIWDSAMQRSFNKGEPYLVLAPATAQGDTWPAVVVIPVVILISGALVILWKKRRPLPYDRQDGIIPSYDASPVQINSTEGSSTESSSTEDGNTESGGAEDNPSPVPAADVVALPDLSAEFLGDEEMIEQYLTKCGGQAYQSDIVKESGLSKSKISIVLAKMKEEGRILKIRKGKENIIRLAKISNSQK